MTFSTPITERTDLLAHRATPDGERRRNPQAAEHFRRALEKHREDPDADPEAEPPPQADAELPTPRKLQLDVGSGRKNHGSHSQHVDVVA